MLPRQSQMRAVGNNTPTFISSFLEFRISVNALTIRQLVGGLIRQLVARPIRSRLGVRRHTSLEAVGRVAPMLLRTQRRLTERCSGEG